MSSPLMTSKNLSLIALEAAPGTAETLVSADCDTRTLKPIGIELSKGMYILDEATGRHTVRGAVPGAQSATITRTIALAAGSALGTAPKWSKDAACSGLLVESVLTFSVDLITLNSVAGSVSADWAAPVAITPQVFTSTHAATMTALAAKIVTAGGAGTVATVGGTNGRSIFVSHPSKIMSLSSFAVTLGASQPTVALRVRMTPHASMDDKTSTGAFQMTPQSGNAVVGTVKGMIGDHAFRIAALGEPLVGEFRYLGCLVDIDDTTPFVLTGADTTYPPRTVGAVMTDATITQHVGGFELLGGHDLQLKEALSDDSGYLQGYIAKRENRLNFEPQARRQSEDASYDRWVAGTQTAFEFATAALNGQRIVIRVPKLQITEMNPGDRNGENTFSKTGIPCEDAGNDAYEISIEGPA